MKGSTAPPCMYAALPHHACMQRLLACGMWHVACARARARARACTCLLACGIASLAQLFDDKLEIAARVHRMDGQRRVRDVPEMCMCVCVHVWHVWHVWHVACAAYVHAACPRCVRDVPAMYPTYAQRCVHVCTRT